MGLGARLGLVFGNVLVLLPVFISLLASAIIATMAQKEMAKMSGVDQATKTVKNIVIALWVLFAGGLVFMFTLGMIIMPLVIEIPYLFGGAIILLGLVNAALAAVLFYAAGKVKATKDTSAAAKSAWSKLITTAAIMTFAAVFMFGYAGYTMHKYHKGGGVTGDVALVGQYGGDIAMAAGQPELAIPLQTVGRQAQQRLNPYQQAELQQRTGQVGQMRQMYAQYRQPQPRLFQSRG